MRQMEEYEDPTYFNMLSSYSTLPEHCKRTINLRMNPKFTPRVTTVLSEFSLYQGKSLYYYVYKQRVTNAIRSRYWK